MAGENRCTGDSLDVFAGVSPDEKSCLEQSVADNPDSALILAAEHFREYELEESAARLATAKALLSQQEVPGLIYFSAIQNVLSEDTESIAQSIIELRSLAPSEMRSAALFLSYYQIGNIDAANVFLNEVLDAFEAQHG